MTQTYFELPNSPDQFGVVLTPSNLRRINFSALDFTTAQRATIEYIKTYHSDKFNDFYADNAIVMLTEIQSSNVGKLALRQDLLANESFLTICQTEEAAMQHMALINQTWKNQTSAIVDVEVTVTNPLTTDLHISAGLRFSLRGPDSGTVYYEVYRAPGDFASDIIIPAGKRGVVAYGIEGRFANAATFTSPGGSNQSFTINAKSILSDPIYMTLDTGTAVESWTITTEPLEKFGSSDKVANVRIYSDRAEFTFGDDANGVAPLAGQTISVRYRTGGGIRGRIASNAINETRMISPLPPAVSPISVRFRNPSPSTGGTDRETLEQAKKRAPREFVVRAFASDRPASIVTDRDYAQVASSFSHPYYGTVSKAIATVRTSKNANLVELYVLALGSSGLVSPSAGLKQALKTYIDEYNINTDVVSVLDGAVKALDIDMTIVIQRNADASFVRDNVETALTDFFDTDNREMGQALYTSDVVKAVMAVDGVLYVDLFTPSDNILPSGELAGVSSSGVGINELIILGNQQLRFHYERS